MNRLIRFQKQSRIFCKEILFVNAFIYNQTGVPVQKRFTMSGSYPQQPIQLSNAVKNITPNPWVRSVQLVREYKPINLGQGFPDYDEVVPQRLKDALVESQRSPEVSNITNQYSPPRGFADLLREVALMYSPLYGRTIDPNKEIMITVGAYEALHCALSVVVNPGDEVIIIEPYFDSYGETIRALGGNARGIPLKLKEGAKDANDFILDKEELKNAFNDKTKCIVVNTPHNPTGKVFSREEIEFIADLCRKYNVMYISDEVYEWLVYDDYKHVHVASFPGMWERTITIGSAGKTFSATGFKTGWVIGPEYLISGCMSLHSGVNFHVPTPTQVAIAETIKQERQLIGTDQSYWKWLVDSLNKKRQRMFDICSKAGFNPIMPCGGYFMITDITQLASELGLDDSESSLPCDERFMEWLIKEKGVASIPVSVFYSEANKKKYSHYLRFCFIKKDEAVNEAEQRLKNLKK